MFFCLFLKIQKIKKRFNFLHIKAETSGSNFLLRLIIQISLYEKIDKIDVHC